MKEVIVETTMYESVDGQLFAVEGECRAHEQKLDVRKYLRFYDQNGELLKNDYFDVDDFDESEVYSIVADNELAENALMDGVSRWNLTGIRSWLKREPMGYPRVFTYLQDRDEFVDVAMWMANLRAEVDGLEQMARKLVETK